MPIFVYQCQEGHVTELIRKIAEREAPAACSKCGKEATPRITSPGGYSISGDNSASVRPKNAGSFKK